MSQLSLISIYIMQITDFFNLDEQNLSFTRQQGSDFAKKIANDFNPIHDTDHKRFCVPGDLLFSVIMHHYGLRQNMTFKFSGMVDENKTINLPQNSDTIELQDDKAKNLLSIHSSGEVTHNKTLIESLSDSYVKFSGRAFPHILVPLMRDNQVMINPDRPLVMYESMQLSLKTLDVDSIALELDSSDLNVDGKRGKASLNYILTSNGDVVGHGQKQMLLSGLREYDASKMDDVVEYYNKRKDRLA